MSGDPVAEAARRANLKWAPRNAQPIPQMIDAAREALAPLRELHRRDGDYCWTCDHTEWPCPTARLVYPAAELTGEIVLVGPLDEYRGQ